MTRVKWFIVRSITVVNDVGFIGGFIKINRRVDTSNLWQFYRIAVRPSRVSGGNYKISVVVNGVATGDLDQKIEIKSNDEIKDLVNRINIMTGNLRTTASVANEIADGNLIDCIVNLPAKLFPQTMAAEAGKNTLIKVFDPAPRKIPAPDAVRPDRGACFSGRIWPSSGPRCASTAPRQAGSRMILRASASTGL